MYAPPPNGILGGSGRILPKAMAARKRGVWFDVANGRNGHIRWDTVDQIVKNGFWPDTLSTDGNSMSRTTGVIDFPNVMSKFLMVGMPLSQVMECATVNP